jgi:hypothetical protein
VGGLNANGSFDAAGILAIQAAALTPVFDAEAGGFVAVPPGGDSSTAETGSSFTFSPLGPAVVPAPLIGHGLPVLLAVGGLLFGAKLLERTERRKVA